ncbi:exosome complex exonuclease Rrp41 [Candidatus Woesearchaeota archaeon CG_4_10_14_0_2_um_filter_57_5]|nr:MAG: exosome complex exonuclease Rrp41 [Candidatus Woesearchaeota archaeon CG_4_10_14_0_2_um_filter_57_5]
MKTQVNIMSKYQRTDGRDADGIRPMEAKVGVIPQADGSAMFKIGNTIAYAAVYGPRELYPRFLQNPETGILRCNYNMMPFSGAGDRVRPGANRRSKEISMVTENALRPVIDLHDCPNAVVDVFIELPQTDAGSRCAGITAAAMALADAGIAMRDMVSAIAVGRIGDGSYVDLSYEEEALEDYPVADIPMAFVNRTGEVTLLQMDGEVQTEGIMDALAKGREACKRIHALQTQALKNKFQGDTQ